jgi:hypothetical protein
MNPTLVSPQIAIYQSCPAFVYLPYHAHLQIDAHRPIPVLMVIRLHFDLLTML